ncbi:hypothetical protein BS054_26750 [Vibrio parahaemolyticus]|nr:hypothetical protein [Vibrio parahaemolyticus]
MNATHIEINEVSWTCAKCGHENKDLIKETNEPLCGGCDQVFDLNQINIDVTTFIGGEETYVNLSELCLIEEKLINELEELTKEDVPTMPFNTRYPVGWTPAYWGTFGEYVPVKFDT